MADLISEDEDVAEGPWVPVRPPGAANVGVLLEDSEEFKTLFSNSSSVGPGWYLGGCPTTILVQRTVPSYALFVECEFVQIHLSRLYT